MSNAVAYANGLPPSGATSRHPAADDGGTNNIKDASIDGIRDYLNQIGRIPLLSAAEEVTLAQDIEVGLIAQEKLNSPESIPVSVARDLEFLASIGRDAKRRFIDSNLRLVVSIAKRYSGRGAAMMDLIQDGNIGLVRAIEKFDYQTGYKFSTYAVWWIRQAIGRGQGDIARLIRVPVHTTEKINRLRRARHDLEALLGRAVTSAELTEETCLSAEEIEVLVEADREPLSLHLLLDAEAGFELADAIEDEESLEVIDTVWVTLRHKELHKRIAELPEREAAVLQLRYGLSGDDPKTLLQVATILGISRERVRQVEARAFKALRCPELRD